MGLWHGIIIPATFVISLFNDNVSIHDVHNNGTGTTSASCSAVRPTGARCALGGALQHLA